MCYICRKAKVTKYLFVIILKVMINLIFKKNHIH